MPFRAQTPTLLAAAIACAPAFGRTRIPAEHTALLNKAQSCGFIEIKPYQTGAALTLAGCSVAGAVTVPEYARPATGVRIKAVWADQKKPGAYDNPDRVLELEFDAIAAGLPVGAVQELRKLGWQAPSEPFRVWYAFAPPGYRFDDRSTFRIGLLGSDAQEIVCSQSSSWTCKVPPDATAPTSRL